MLKTTLKAPKTNKITKAIIGGCQSAGEVAEAIGGFWGDGPIGGDERFIFSKLSKLLQQAEPSETEILAFTAMTTALMGKTLKSAKQNMFMNSSMMFMDFAVSAAKLLNLSWVYLGTERAWKFIFVSGDLFRIRPAIQAWRDAKTVEDRDAAARVISAIVKSIQEADGSLKGGVVMMILNRAGDLLNNSAANIFMMMATSDDRVNAATLTQEQAGQKLAPMQHDGAAMLEGLTTPVSAAMAEAKQLVVQTLDVANADSLEWLNVKTQFGSNHEKVVDALINGRFGFGSAAELNGCQNYLQNNITSKGAASWLKDFIATPISKVAPIIDEMREKLLSTDVVSDADAAEWVSGIKISKKLMNEYNEREGRDGAFIDDLKAVYKLAGGQLKTLKAIDLNRGRSFAHQAKKVIALNPRGGKKVLWHEVGHHFEYSNPDALKMATSYLTGRAGGDRTAIRPLNKFYYSNYSDDEVGITDALSSPYVGKVYAAKNSRDTHAAYATEVFSSAFEYLANSEAGAVSLLNDDQLLQLVCGFLKGVHGL
jgi:hypothetical protein